MKTISFLTAAALGGTFLAAQETPTVRELDELVVTANRQSSGLTVSTLEEVREDLQKTPGAVEAIDAERFLRGRSSTLADTFALSPGVVAQPRFGSDEARLSIRGSGLQRTFHGRGIRVLQDGVPLNLADGGFDMQAIDPLATDHVSVLRGGNALSLGSSTLGGAINYVSANGLTSPGGSLRVEGGSYDYFRARISAGGSKDGLDGYFSLSEAYQSGFRDHAEQNAQRLFANVGWRISDTVETRAYLTAINTESQLPGNLTKAELEDDPRQADESFFGAMRYDNRRDFQLYRLASKTTFKTDLRTLDVIASYAYKDLDHPITPFAGVIDQLSHDLMAGTVYTDENPLAGHDNRFRAGMFVTYGRTNNATFANVLGERGALTGYSDQTALNLEGFVEDQWAIGRGFTAVLGATAAHARRDNDVSAGTSADYDRHYNDFSPKAGLRWDHGDVQIYGNVSSSFEPPSFSEANGALTPNKAQTANTVEFGTRGQHRAFRWDAGVYAAKVENEFLALNDSSGTPLGTTNADATLHQGIELGTEIDLLGTDWKDQAEHRLVLRGAWTYGRFKFDDDATYGDNTLAGLPPHLIRGELLWETSSGYYFGPTVEWVPVKSYVDHANTLSADPYALLGFKVGRRVAEGISWFVEAKNLTDETYAATTGVEAVSAPNSRNFLPGDGRSVFAGIEWKW